MPELDYQNAGDFRRERRRPLGRLLAGEAGSLHAVAAAVGGRYVAMDSASHDQIVARLDPWTVTLDATVSWLAIVRGTVRLRSHYQPRDGFGLTVRAATPAVRWAERRGLLAVVKVDPPPFDAEHAVTASDPGLARAVLDGAAVRAALAAQPLDVLRVGPMRTGRFAPRAATPVGEVRLTLVGGLADVDRVRRAFGLVTAVLDRLVAVGSADPLPRIERRPAAGPRSASRF